MNIEETIEEIARIVLDAEELAKKARPLTEHIGRGTQQDPKPLASELLLDENTRNQMGW